MGTEKRERQKAGRQARREAEQKVAKRKRSLRRVVTIGIAVAVVVGVSLLLSRPWEHSSTVATTTTTSPTSAAQAKADAASKAAGCPSDPTAALPNPQYKAPPMTIDTTKTYTVTITTDLGTIVATLDAKTAPVAVNSFVFLADKKYYDCNIFHRVIPQFVNQTGDPTGTGTGGPGYTVQGEVPATATPQYPLGSLAMAKTTQSPPGTTSNEFFIVAGSQGETLPPQYALVGQVTSGESVVQAINADGSQSGTPPTVTHRMLSLTVTSS